MCLVCPKYEPSTIHIGIDHGIRMTQNTFGHLSHIQSLFTRDGLVHIADPYFKALCNHATKAYGKKKSEIEYVPHVVAFSYASGRMKSPQNYPSFC